MERKIDEENVKLLIFCSPHNPVGRVWSAEELESLTPAQQIVKIVNEELIKVMGESAVSLNKSKKIPTVIMMVGLQGAGKTTTAGKLAYKLKKEENARNSIG